MTNCTEICKWNGTYNGTEPFKKSDCEFIDRNAIGELLTASTIKEALEKANTNGYRVLCLDGGGIRGMVLTSMLIEIERYLRKPVIEYFDWVAGTSTGGILALGLVTGKTTKECLCMYFRMKEYTFVGSRPYPSENLENMLKDVFGEISYMSEIRKPHIMITALLADRYPVDLHIFRNYSSPNSIIGVPEQDSLDGLPVQTDHIIWHVARATGAAPTYFRPFSRFLDGGLISNNPTLDALTEIHEYNSALKIASRTDLIKPISLVLSLGTGQMAVSKCSDIIDCEGLDNIIKSAMRYHNLIKLLKLLIDQATQTSGRVIDRARAWCHSINVPYFRFNPEISEDIAMDEKSDEKLIKLLIETKAYMHHRINDIKSLSELLLRKNLDEVDMIS